MKLPSHWLIIGLFPAVAPFSILLSTGCRTVPLDPLDPPLRVHDPASGPAIRNTRISVNDGDEALTSGNTCFSPLRNKAAFGGIRSTTHNRHNVWWEYIETIGKQDAYYIRVWGEDWEVPQFADVVLYQGGSKVVYAEADLKVLLSTEP